jgi:CDP-diacylglycerol--glycerol-3-phosphate 3-phosphatidyltransferase
MKTWIPNLLTASRLLLLPPIMVLLSTGHGVVAHWWAFGLFLVASLSDTLDGWAARRLGCASNIGIFFDPLADKIFANVLLIYLACDYPSWIPLWAVLLLLAREFAVQGFRSMTPCLGVVISTGRLSKLKLVFQLIAAGTALAGLGWEDAAPLLRAATWLALGLALASGGWSMLTLFRDNADLWARVPLQMEKR